MWGHSGGDESRITLCEGTKSWAGTFSIWEKSGRFKTNGGDFILFITYWKVDFFLEIGFTFVISMYFRIFSFRFAVKTLIYVLKCCG